MKIKAALVASLLTVSTLSSVVMANPAPVASATTYGDQVSAPDPGTVTPTPTTPTTPLPEVWDTNVDPTTYESINEDSVTTATFNLLLGSYLLSSTMIIPPPDDCAPEWRALINAKDWYNKSIVGGLIVGVFSAGLGFGIAGKALLDLGKARTAMERCCKGKEKQTSCDAAITQNYLK